MPGILAPATLHTLAAAPIDRSLAPVMALVNLQMLLIVGACRFLWHDAVKGLRPQVLQE